MSSGFISEAAIAEQRKLRQEEWDRVRTAEQPTDAPEEPYDPRSLYERLQEQKNKRDIEYEEAHKLKNMIKGLDDDEVEFLDLVDRTKLEEERKKNLEEEKEMRDFKEAVASLQEKALDEKLKQELKNPLSVSKHPSSGRLRYIDNESKGTKRKHSDSEYDKEISNKNEECLSTSCEIPKMSEECLNDVSKNESPPTYTISSKNQIGGLKCIGILPGLGSYQDSSDSDCSSDSDQESEQNQVKFDLLGRKIERPAEIEKS
ncbi:protein FAM192A [Orussus abietinus]|uniref:protein FAM192A n=1 Tax=Orussus abietinus TaxID=222816 RepID=UPI000C715B74|nr:protein FAM192A [Orussus abietinus]